MALALNSQYPHLEAAGKKTSVPAFFLNSYDYMPFFFLKFELRAA